MTVEVVRCSPASQPSGARSGRTTLAWVRMLVGGVILSLVVWRSGSGPFLAGLRAVTGSSLLAAAAIAVLTTVCSAWRWCLVARGLGASLLLRTAIAAYYRSQFLNTMLPGGVLGDVHRGWSHGREVDDVGRGLLVVVWERFTGQFVQVVLTILVLLALPSPVRSSMPAVLAAVAVVALCAVLLSRALPRPGRSWWGGVQKAWPGIVLASLVVVAGHTATFLLAARTAGSTASPSVMVPLALLVLVASAVPTNVGGWGPREGVAAWAFGAAGLGAGMGVATAVVYGVMVLVASLPGAGVMVVTWIRRDLRRRTSG